MISSKQWRDSVSSLAPCLFVLAFIAPIAVYYYFIIILSLNVPYGDDYDAILSFVVSANNAGSYSDLVKLFLSRHAEHQIVIVKFFGYLNFIFSGEINFIHLVFLGNLSLLAILAAVVSGGKVRNKYMLIPLPFILFQFSYFQSSLWAMASLSNFYSVMFSFLAFMCLKKSDRSYNFFILGCVLAMLAMFSFGNGIFSFVVGFFILFSLGCRKKLFIYTLFFLHVLFLYYFFGDALNSNRPSFDFSFSGIIEMFDFFFVFLGSFFMKYKLSFNAGVMIFLIFCYLTYKKYYKENMVLYSFWLFLILSALVTAYARAFLGSEYALESRYAFYSSLLLLLAYLFVSSRLLNHPWLLRALFYSVLLVSVSMYFKQPVKSAYFQYRNMPYTLTVAAEKDKLLGKDLDAELMKQQYIEAITMFESTWLYRLSRNSKKKEKYISSLKSRSALCGDNLSLGGAIPSSSKIMLEAQESGIYLFDSSVYSTYLQ